MKLINKRIMLVGINVVFEWDYVFFFFMFCYVGCGDRGF